MIGYWLLENKLNRMIEMGKLSREGIEKARKAGLFKSEASYMRGFNKGTKNIIKKAGYKVVPKDQSMLDSGANFVSREIHIPKYKNYGKATHNKYFRQAVDFAKRHEANEAVAQRKLYPHDPVTRANKATWEVGTGMHTHPNVLQKERKYINFATKAYPTDHATGTLGSGANEILQSRKIHSEYTHIGKSKNEMRKINKKFTRSAIKGR